MWLVVLHHFYLSVQCLGPPCVALLPEGTALLHVSIQVHIYRDVLAHMLPMFPGHSRHLAAHAAFPIVNIIPAPGPVRYWDLLSWMMEDISFTTASENLVRPEES